MEFLPRKPRGGTAPSRRPSGSRQRTPGGGPGSPPPHDRAPGGKRDRASGTKHDRASGATRQRPSGVTHERASSATHERASSSTRDRAFDATREVAAEATVERPSSATSEAYTKVRTAEVTDGDVGIRLDRWFSRQIPELGHGRLQKLLRTGQVRVNGARAAANMRLEAGQTIRIPPLPGLGDKPAPGPRVSKVSDADTRDLQARVLYRDDDVIALNKPAGLAVQGGTGTSRHLDGMLDALQFDAKERPKLVHRLDRDTSGVLLLARSSRAAAALTRAFRGRGVEKTYWALVLGVPKPKQGTIDLALAKATGPTGREKMEESEEGDDAVTDYRVRENMKRAAWVELWPHTGRTHQLRAHMAAIGTPIIGDQKYGGPDSKLPGISPKLHLHAAQIALRLPSGKAVTIAAPLPEHMAQTWALFGFEVPKSMRQE